MHKPVATISDQMDEQYRSVNNHSRLDMIMFDHLGYPRNKAELLTQVTSFLDDTL
jgi:hypothetical protein